MSLEDVDEARRRKMLLEIREKRSGVVSKIERLQIKLHDLQRQERKLLTIHEKERGWLLLQFRETEELKRTLPVDWRGMNAASKILEERRKSGDG